MVKEPISGFYCTHNDKEFFFFWLGGKSKRVVERTKSKGKVRVETTRKANLTMIRTNTLKRRKVIILKSLTKMTKERKQWGKVQRWSILKNTREPK